MKSPEGAEAFRETFLAPFSTEDADALRRVGGMLLGYNLEARPTGPDPEEPFRQWRSVAQDLNHLKAFVLELVGMLPETVGLEPAGSERLQALGKARAAELGKLAKAFEEDVEAELR